MKIVAIIPARLASTRLPRKVLRNLAGQPMLAHVYEAVRMAKELRDVIVATDSGEVLAVCRQRGWNVRLTSPAHTSGTQRVHEVAGSVPADVYLNIQGDEPLVRVEHIQALVQLMQDPRVEVGTVKVVAEPEDICNSNAVKVVTSKKGRALYFSRATIPFDRDGTQPLYFKHLGFYAYRKAALDRFCSWPESALEKSERLEQLRFLENGTRIYVAETPFNTIGVDTEEDLKRAEELLLKKAVPSS